MARGTRIQPGWNGSQTTTDRGAPNNSSAVTIKYTPPVARQGALKALVANIQKSDPKNPEFATCPMLNRADQGV